MILLIFFKPISFIDKLPSEPSALPPSLQALSVMSGYREGELATCLPSGRGVAAA